MSTIGSVLQRDIYNVELNASSKVQVRVHVELRNAASGPHIREGELAFSQEQDGNPRASPIYGEVANTTTKDRSIQSTLLKVVGRINPILQQVPSSKSCKFHCYHCNR